ncbi:bifunctional UDP-N-acetylglucosamine pyrophosphorylase / Glucosamine-1-phosphate N-acetyltransferase [Anaerobranca californiensis DSM 14826]|uniref:Bifunctional protein GlmU n=1 Tax=Anaerobranca californiensis DSM 14826 TaxID=1120989 RepID=A0A1M6PJ94_9FIRM|nr:bifunctional UDP-N-acetylglucosamine diphosphorylase/glucosamine-1-phosphate N-acetyltransferase GlmU [Anaerobranca californiensis]SHK08000.1 bifunctional UDP-N-acetylglucosamine pyrophosphorylase / Glucosamine-1-phosphate N-acetyltransferase [Anaerobranca californiensis DSM 14826]
MKKLNAIILAAGKGTRMKSDTIKVLHKLLDKPMLEYIYDALEPLHIEKVVTIVGHQKEKIYELYKDKSFFAEQREQLGTGHAVLQAKDFFVNCSDEDVLVLCGDTPLLTTNTLQKFIKYHQQNNFSCTVLTAIQGDPTGYGRIIRNENNEVISIVEEKDASLEQKKIKEVNTGIFVFNVGLLFELLPKVKNSNAQGEYYLPDVLQLLLDRGEKIGAQIMDNPQEMAGINDRIKLYEAEQILKLRINKEHMLNGVTIIDPLNTYISTKAKIQRDVVIYPMTFIEGHTEIGKGTVIGPNTKIVESKIGENTEIIYSVVQNSEIANNVSVGPFAYIRPNTKVDNHVRIGNFVELKNTVIGENSKAAHLAYLGDAVIGKNVNIGCGTITVNFDGKNKHKTVIESDVFVGSNSNLVAPVTLREGSFIAAGSTITEDVPEYSLAIARSRQTIKKGWKKKV